MLSGQIRGMLAIAGYISALAAILCGGQAAWQHHRRAHILQTWPLVEATTVHSCSLGINRAFTRTSNHSRLYLYIACDIIYPGPDRTYSGSIRSASRETSHVDVVYSADGRSSSQVNAEPLLREWLQRHPARSKINIHYNPGRPTETSLAGTDPVLDIDPFFRSRRDAIRGALFTIVFFGIIWGDTLVSRKRGLRGSHLEPSTN